MKYFRKLYSSELYTNKLNNLNSIFQNLIYNEIIKIINKWKDFLASIILWTPFLFVLGQYFHASTIFRGSNVKILLTKEDALDICFVSLVLTSVKIYWIILFRGEFFVFFFSFFFL